MPIDKKTIDRMLSNTTVFLATRERRGERGAGVVEYLGLAAMAVGVIVALMAAMTDIGRTVLESIKDMVS